MVAYDTRGSSLEGEMWDDFRKFLMRGNVLDMAVGIAVGTAFTAVVKSLVDNVLMPPIGLLLGSVDFSNLFAVIKKGTPPGPYATLAAAEEAGAVTWRYGMFFNSVISFVIVAAAMFLVIRAMNKFMTMVKVEEEAPAAAPTTKECPYCKTQIPIAAVRCPNCTSQLGAG